MYSKIIVILPFIVGWGLTRGNAVPKKLHLSSVNKDDAGLAVISPSGMEMDRAEIMPRSVCFLQDIPAMCGHYILTTAQQITITTPKYPKNYQNDFHCPWTFQSADTNELSLTCEDFLLDTLKKDFLSVEYDPAIGIKEYRLKNKPSVKTKGGLLKLKFSSNADTNAKGFKCIVKHLGVLTTTSTTTTTTTTTTTPKPLPLSHRYCGLVNTRIVNGNETLPHEYPWMVWTNITWSDGLQRGCGGTIIHEEWILTAAHCPYRLNKAQNAIYVPKSINITVGSHLRDNPRAHGGYIAEVDVKAIHIYPTYEMPHDIALYKLKRPLIFTQTVAPICLAPREWTNESFVGVPVTLAGWGKTESGNFSSYLRDYNTVGYSFSSCKQIYGNWMETTQMCTDGKDAKHSCASDSGGPVMRMAQGRAFQVGVISFSGSSDCKDTSPNVQVRVTSFIDWFESVTGLTFAI